MADVTTRATFERLIEIRLEAARHLLAVGDWDTAYYLAGYVVEYAFKVKITDDVLRAGAVPNRKTVDEFYRHDLKGLRATAKLDKLMAADPSMTKPWQAVEVWSEQSRFALGTTEAKARELFEAIEQGVLPWVKARW